MQESDYRVYVLFPNHTEGLRLNSILRDRGINHAISPTPRVLSRSCGISLIVNEDDLELIKEIIAEHRITIENVAKAPVNKNWRYRGS